jgi:uncharacterized protein (DUF433 family)
VSAVTQIVSGSEAEIIAEYPDLEAEDIQQALRYAAWTTEETVYVPVEVST